MKYFLYLLLSFALVSYSKATEKPAKIWQLTCEYQKNPMGIDQVMPLMGWKINTSKPGFTQKTYHILVASSREMLNRNIGNIWDSKEINSSQSQNVQYKGKAFRSAAYYYWKVRIQAADGTVLPWSEVAYWSTGLLSATDWKGKWITDRVEPAEKTNTDSAALYLRKPFSLNGKVRRATAYVCGLGYYELYINGKKVGDHVLDPIFTDYQKHISYATYDVTASLKKGKNAFGAILGNGFYSLPGDDLFGMQKAPWKAPHKLLLDVHIEYENGATATISSDETWKWSKGELVFNSIRGGETIDHRLQQNGWNTTDFEDRDWKNVLLAKIPMGKLKSQSSPPMKVNEIIAPVKISEPKKGIYVVDFGKNITGWIALDVKGAAGTRIQCWSNEVLNKDSTLNIRNSSGHTEGRFQREDFILSGEGTEHFEPRFTYHGFRYVQLQGLSSRPSLKDITAKSVHTSLDTTGTFSCSDEHINNLQKAVQRTLLNSIHGMPAEEPTREKMGWTWDAAVTMDSYLYNFDAVNAYKKYLQDLMDAQEKSGHIPAIVPTNGWGLLSADGKPIYWDDPWWGGAVFFVTDRLYQQTGDTGILTYAFPALKKYVDFVGSTAKNDLVKWSLGDWLDMTHNSKGPGLTPVEQTSTAGYYWMAERLSAYAGLLGKPEIAAQYEARAKQIKVSFNKAYLDRSTGWYTKGSQTAQAMPLFLGLVPDGFKSMAESRLIEAILANNNHISAGFLGVLPLLNYLPDHSYKDKAYQVFSQKESPGWLHMVTNDKSTLGENLNIKGYGSGHHPYGAHIGYWMFKYLGGIRVDENKAGFQQFIIEPFIPGDLKWVKTSTNSLYGKIVSSWEKNEKEIKYMVTVPPNTSATIILPAYRGKTILVNGMKTAAGKETFKTVAGNDKISMVIGSGDYEFLVR